MEMEIAEIFLKKYGRELAVFECCELRFNLGCYA